MKGKYIRTKEHKELMSSLKKGFRHTEEAKEKLRIINLGKRYSDEINKKKSLPGKLNGMYGKKRPDLVKINKEKHMVGKLNPSWKGGLSFEPYGSEFNKILKKQIKCRDKFTCQLCGDTILKPTLNKFLSIHHIDYNKMNNNKENLITLCNFCNSSVNSSREQWTNYFQEKLGEVRNK